MTSAQPWCAVNVDMDSLEDYTRVYAASGAAGLGDAVYTSCVDTMTQFFAEQQIPGTFFVVTKDVSVPVRRAAIARIRDAGHELGTHSWSHNIGKPEHELRQEFDLGVRLMRDELGVVPRGYRAPAYVVHDFIYERLVHHGYLYSSSVLTTPLMLAFKLLFNLKTLRNRSLSRGERLHPWGRWQALLAPSDTYKPARAAFWKAAPDGAILEIPLTCAPRYGYPFQFTYLAALGTSLVERLAAWLDQRPVNFSLHLLDFIDDDYAARLGHFNPNLRIPLKTRLAAAAVIVALIRDRRRVLTLEGVARAA